MTANCKISNSKKLVKPTPLIRPTVLLLLVLTIFTVFVNLSFAHPSSGIVVDQKGNVYFSDLSRGLLIRAGAH